MKTKKFSPYSKIRKSPFFLAAKKVCEILQNSGFEAYFVGGSVRDLMMSSNKLPKDIDLATSALPENILTLFPSSRFVGESFGVCMVQVGAFCFEVATFRVDGEYVDKRRPSFVTKGNFFEDSCRRDFTINALYYDPHKKIIKDPHGGRKDIQQKIIRCVGDPQARFDEDALRVLRALRFAANFDFSLDPATKNALMKFSPHIKFLAKERILHEFVKVKNFNLFIQLITHNINLEDFFTHSHCFVRRPVDKNKYFPFIAHPMLHFLLHLSLFYEISYQFKEELSLWPLTKQDSTLCQIYLKLFLYEEDRNQEEAQFLIFIQLLKINKICPASLRIILMGLLVVYKKEKLISFVRFVLSKKFEFSNFSISDKIIAEMEKNQVPNYYTQIFIDYYHYKSFMSIQPLNYENFVEENFAFVEKIKEILEKS